MFNEKNPQKLGLVSIFVAGHRALFVRANSAQLIIRIHITFLCH